MRLKISLLACFGAALLVGIFFVRFTPRRASTMLSGARIEQKKTATQNTPPPLPGQDHSAPIAPTSEDYAALGLRYKNMPVDGARAQLMEELVLHWMRRDPSRCMNFLAALADDPVRHALSQRAMQLWLKQDNAAAMAYAEIKIRSDESNCQFYLLPIFEDRFNNSGFTAVVQQLDMLPKTPAVYGELLPVFCAYLKQDLSGGRAFAESLSVELGKAGYQEIVGASFAMQDPGVALAAVESGAVKSQRETMGILAILFKKKPDETLAWIQQQAPSATLDAVRYREGKARVQSAPETALSLAEGLSDVTQKNEIISDALGFLATKDFAQAETRAVASDIAPEVAAAALVRAEIKPDNQSFQTEMTAANNMIDAKQQMRTWFGVYSRWVGVDPAAAAQWLDSSPIPKNDKDMFKLVHPR